MQRSLGLSLLLVVGAVAAAATGAAVVAASSEYEISVVGAIDTPTETVEDDGDEFEIDEVGAVERGGTITADVASPDTYNVLLYNTNEQTEDELLNEDADRVQFDADLEPGTYMLSLEADADRKAIAPVVVQGYDLALEYDSTVAADDEVTFEATAEPVGDLEQPDEIEVAIWDGETATELALEHAGGANYETTTSLSDLEPGTYDVYGAVPGDDTVKGYDTFLAVQDGQSLTVTEPDDGDEGDGEDEQDNESDGTIGGGSPGNETDGEDGNETENGDDAAENETDAEGDVAGNETDASNGDSESDTGADENDSSGGESGEDDADESENDVIQPTENESDETESGDGSADDVGTPTGALAAIAIGAVLVVAGRRIDR